MDQLIEGVSADEIYNAVIRELDSKKSFGEKATEFLTKKNEGSWKVDRWQKI
jgi:hypothetical protein